MKAENLGFKESVEFLADRAKLDIPQNSDDKEELPKLEELYSKVKEMRVALESIYTDYTKKLNTK